MASEDIAPKLIAGVRKEFQRNCLKDVEMRKLSEKVGNGEATYEDAYKYAESIGTARANAFKSVISSDVLPDGKMYYNIAERLMTDSLTTDHNMVADFSEMVQQAINDYRIGIDMKAQRADLDEDRIDGFVQRLASEDNYDDVAWITQEPVKTHARSVVDDTIKKNAEFQHKAGIKVAVKRDAASDCCKWCDGLVGDYTYPGVPRDVFARHDNCRCTLDYNGRRLTAYESKSGKSNTFRDQGEQEKIEARKAYAQDIDENNAKKKDGQKQVFSSKTTNLRDEYLGRSISAKFENFDIMDLETGEIYHIVENEHLQNKEVFAGKGSSDPYRDAWKFADRYGGKVEDWQHVKGEAWLETEDGNRYGEVHWSQCEGIGKKEPFLKKWLDE